MEFAQADSCSLVDGRVMSVPELGEGVQSAAQVIALALIAFALFMAFLKIFFIVARASGFLSAPRRRHFRTAYPLAVTGPDVQRDLTDVGQQLHAVMAAAFQRRRLLSSSEYRVFKVIEDDVTSAQNGYRVFAQTSLGQVLRSPDENAFRSINSKRVDILVVDRGGWPVLAVEYQGNGHYQGTAAARDAIKKEALRKAGVRYVEISTGDSDNQIRSRVREHLGWNAAAAAE